MLDYTTLAESEPMVGESGVDNRTLVEAELVATIGWLIRIRWIAGGSVLLATWVLGSILGLKAPEIALYAIGVGILFYNLVFYLLEQRLDANAAGVEGYARLAKWQTAMDWIAMTLLVHYSGGIESPAIVFFIFHIIIDAIFFEQRTVFGFVGLAVALLTGIGLLEYYGMIPHKSIIGFLDVPLYRNELYVFATLLFFSSTSVITAYLVSSIHERLGRREEEIVRLSKSLRVATNRLQALNEGARTIGSTLELRQVLDRLVESTAKVMGVQACSIRLLDKSGGHLEPVAVHGLSQAYLDKGPVVWQTNPLARQVLSGKIVNIPDVSNSDLLQYPAEARQEGIKSMLSAPLIGKTGTLGIIRAYSVEADHFTKDDEAFLAGMAAQGSVAIENALAYQAVEELDQSKSQFVRMVTHELRSPVSVTSSLLRTMAAGYAGEINEQQQDILNRSIRRIDFLQGLVDDLLDLAAGKTDVTARGRLEPLKLAPAVEKVVRRFEVSAKEKGVTLSCQDRCAEEEMVVMATPEGLDRVFNNLVSNAVKYTPAGGSVNVTLSSTEGEAQVVVEDTGIGIPTEAMESLFTEFYRAPNAKDVEREGTGLGLTIVKDTLDRMAGRISVLSNLEKGSKFIVILPMTNGVDEQLVRDKENHDS
jgi:signal transduction histidine kinase